jgi:5-methyltetrahydrofolate--homocysteine methyltransferase
MSVPRFDRPTAYDGAKGTLLAPLLTSVGRDMSDVVEWLNVLAPELVLRCYRDYLDAGAEVIQTNTFNGNALRLAHYGLKDQAHRINLAAAQLAREAAGEKAAVAGSLGPTGKLMMMGEVGEEEVREAFAEQAKALEEGGVDFFHIETMSDLQEATAAVEGIRSVSDLPVALTMSFDTGDGEKSMKTMMGVSPAALVEKGNDLGLLAVGDNCGRGLEGYQVVAEELRASSPRSAIIMKVNAGVPQVVEGQVVYDASPEQAAEYALWCARKGVRLIGTCCGGTPRHIEAIANALARGI